jgi:hypothetical protein
MSRDSRPLWQHAIALMSRVASSSGIMFPLADFSGQIGLLGMSM